MKILTLVIPLLLLSCKPRAYNEGQSSTSSDSSSCEVAGLPTVGTGSSPSVVFHWTSDPLAETQPETYLQRLTEKSAAQNRSLLCENVNLLKQGGMNALGVPEDLRRVLGTEGLNGGYGVYAAADPLSSSRYGNILLAIEVPPNKQATFSVSEDDMGDLDWGDRAKHVVSNQPAIVYKWGRTLLTQNALVIRDLAFLKRPDGKIGIKVYKTRRPEVLANQMKPISVSPTTKWEDVVMAYGSHGFLFESFIMGYGWDAAGKKITESAVADILRSDITVSQEAKLAYQKMGAQLKCQFPTDCAFKATQVLHGNEQAAGFKLAELVSFLKLTGHVEAAKSFPSGAELSKYLLARWHAQGGDGVAQAMLTAAQVVKNQLASGNHIGKWK